MVTQLVYSVTFEMMVSYPTEHDENAYNIRVISCGDSIEIYRYNGKIIKTNRIVKERQEYIKREISEYEKYETRVKNLNKARNKLSRLIKCNSDLNYFITLTFATEPTIEESKKLLHLFFVKVRKDVPDIKYIWIVEFGEKNKRLHYHLLTNFPFPEGISFSDSNKKKTDEQKQLEVNFQKKYWNKSNCGWVDIRKLSDESIYNVSIYVSAYMVKSLVNFDLVNQQVFNHSRNLDKPIIDTYMTCDTVNEILLANKYYNLEYFSSYSYFNGNVNYFNFKEKG